MTVFLDGLSNLLFLRKNIRVYTVSVSLLGVITTREQKMAMNSLPHDGTFEIIIMRA